jgi:hypothetical protein
VITLEPCAAREIGWLTGGASLSAMRGRERARVSAAGRWGRAATREREHVGRAGERGEAGRRWAEGEGDCTRGEGEAAGMGRKLAQPGEERFLFFLIFIFYFHFFYLLSSIN